MSETTEVVEQQPIITEQQQPATPEPPTATAPVEQPIEEVADIKPFNLPMAEEKNPFENLTAEDLVKNYKGDSKALLKALGLDDYITEAVDYYGKTKDLTPYLEAKSVDWTKLSAEKVIENKLREQYSGYNLSDEQVNKMIQKELRTKYFIGVEADPESEEADIAKIQLQIDAENHRKAKIEFQQKFRAPEVKEQAPQQPQMTQEQQVVENFNQLKQDDTIKKFLQSGKLTFGDASSQFNYEAKNPQEVAAIIADPNRYAALISKTNEQGQIIMKEGRTVPDTQKLIESAIWLRDKNQIIKNAIDYGRSLGVSKVIDEAENPVDNRTTGTEAAPYTLEDALNKALLARR